MHPFCKKGLSIFTVGLHDNRSLLQLQVGVEFEASARMQDTSMSFGYQLDVPKANLQFKGKDVHVW